MKTYKVPEMSCSHCEARITAALKAVPEITDYTIDLAGRKVSVETSLPEARVVEIFDEAGYDAEPV